MKNHRKGIKKTATRRKAKSEKKETPEAEQPRYLRAGEVWENSVEINFGEGYSYPVEISFRPDTPTDSL